MRSRNVYGRHGREGDSPGVCKSKRRREFVKGKEDEDEDEDEEEDEVWKKIGYLKKKKRVWKGDQMSFHFCIIVFIFI